jgi:rare lipoprotein A
MVKRLAIAGIWGILLTTLLAACSTAPPPKAPPSAGKPATDSAPARRLNPDQIADAIPRSEPRSRYGNPASYSVLGQSYQVMESGRGHAERGIASWYGTKFHGRRTSSGEPYDMYAMTAAHKTLPLPSYVRVTNLRNSHTTVVKVNDRGPFHENRIIDLSYAAATKLGILGQGTGLVEIEVLDPAQPEPPPKTRAQQPAKGPTDPDLFIQVGAFSSLENAERLRKRLHQTLRQPLRIQQTRRNDRSLFRVQIGPLPRIEQADAITSRLVTLGIDNPRIIVE